MATLVTKPNGAIPFTDDRGLLTDSGLRMLQQFAVALNGQTANGATQIQLGNSINLYSGVGNPNNVVTESPGAIYINLSGGAGTTLYVKESGTSTNTGWIGK